MNKVLSFIGLDMRLMKPYMKSAAVMLGLGIVLGIVLKAGEMVLSMSTVMLLLVMQYPFAVAEKGKLDTLYGTLTVDRKTVVTGRYLFAVLFALAGVIISFACSILITYALSKEVDFTAYAFIMCLIFSVFLVVIGFQFPVYFKYGFTKGRMFAYIPLFAVFILIAVVPLLGNMFNLNMTLEGMFKNLINHAVISCLVSLAIGIAVLIVSCFISYRIYERKDI